MIDAVRGEGASFSSLNLDYLNEINNQETNKVIDVAYRFFTSPLNWTLGLMGAAYFFVPTITWVIGCTVTFTLFATFPKRLPASLLYELSLVHNFMNDLMDRLGIKKGAYMNHLQDGVYLGALPLKSRHNHQEILLRDKKIYAVLSAVEEFEVTRKTYFTDPITPDDWKRLGVNHLLIETSDMTPISLEGLMKAADFIHQHKDGIYIHCKAGRGRSMMCYLAYLMKYENKSFQEALRIGKEKRPLMSIKPSQFKVLKEFENIIKLKEINYSIL